ncbi:hypothetical protein BDL97_14G083800 [Sphagnum fallax]|nr:hypothetical protein BDL97_14G083800 [Sphagnum fallax]
MVLKVTEVSYSLDRLLEQQTEIESKEVGLLSSSLSRLGDGYLAATGSLSLRSSCKRSASLISAAAEPLITSCPSSISTSLSSCLTSSLVLPATSSPAKAATTTTTALVSSSSSCSSHHHHHLHTCSCPRPITPISTALPKLRNSGYKISDHNGGHMVKWLTAMKAQSPPHFRSLIGDHKFDFFDAKAAEYAAWTEKHIPILDVFEKVMKTAKGKQVAVFLDYDGTLSPIVEDPDRAYMSDDMRATVREVATFFPTAIISGRGRQKVYEFVQLPELFYAGSHGMDIMGPADGCNGFKASGTLAKDKKGNDIVFFQPASEYLPLINKVCKLMEDNTKDIEGAKVEHNLFCATVHFRRVKEENWVRLAERVANVMKGYPTLSLTHGRKVLEIRPGIAWDKGQAVNFLLESLGMANPNDVLPVYIGDDRTDEDAFKLLNGMKHGCSILVSTVPKSTNAAYSIRNPSEVKQFLHQLVQWRMNKNPSASSRSGSMTTSMSNPTLKYKRTP